MNVAHPPDHPAFTPDPVMWGGQLYLQPSTQDNLGFVQNVPRTRLFTLTLAHADESGSIFWALAAAVDH